LKLRGSFLKKREDCERINFSVEHLFVEKWVKPKKNKGVKNKNE